MAEEESYYTPSQAARILRITSHRVRQMLNAGELEGERDTESGHWKIPAWAVHARLSERREAGRRLRARRQEAYRQAGEGDGPQESAPGEEPATGTTEAAEAAEERVVRLEVELSRTQRELGRMEGRLELTEHTESTLREERARLLEDLERERADHHRQRERAESLEAELQTELQRARAPWWRRLLGRG